MLPSLKQAPVSQAYIVYHNMHLAALSGLMSNLANLHTDF
jgi:hypothetical protein